MPDWRPRLTGWHSAEWRPPLDEPGPVHVKSTGQVFEPGNPAYPALYVLDQSLDYLAGIGMERIEAHTLAMSGYPQRGNPILGLVKEGDKLTLARDGKPYTTLGFANGPGSVCKPAADGKWLCDRPDLTNVDTTALGFLQQSLVPLGSETHGGEDVAIFAGGPGANLFSGTVEQNEIFHVMVQSLGLIR